MPKKENKKEGFRNKLKDEEKLESWFYSSCRRACLKAVLRPSSGWDGRTVYPISHPGLTPQRGPSIIDVPYVQ
jgi:hypothetical protein